MLNKIENVVWFSSEESAAKVRQQQSDIVRKKYCLDLLFSMINGAVYSLSVRLLKRVSCLAYVQWLNSKGQPSCTGDGKNQ